MTRKKENSVRNEVLPDLYNAYLAVEKIRFYGHTFKTLEFYLYKADYNLSPHKRSPYSKEDFKEIYLYILLYIDIYY